MPVTRDQKTADTRREQINHASKRLRQKRIDAGSARLELWLSQETLKWLDYNRGRKTRQEALTALLQAHARRRLPIQA